MSSVDNDPRLTQSLVDDCLPLVLSERSYDHPQPIRKVGEEAYFRQSGSIGPRLAPLVEEATKGRFTVRRADRALHDGLAQFTWPEYFVRCELREDLPDVVTVPTDDMVLYEINPHRGLLTIGAPMRSAEGVAAVYAEREAAHEAERQRVADEARLREEVNDDLGRMFGRLELYVQADGRHSILEEWWRLQRKVQQNLGDLPMRDVMTLCHRIGIDFTHLSHQPAAATP